MAQELKVSHVKYNMISSLRYLLCLVKRNEGVQGVQEINQEKKA